MMLSFGVFCFDLVVNKKLLVGDHGEDRNLVRNLLRMFHFFLGHHPHADQLQRKSVRRHMTNWRHVYFLSGMLDCLREKIFLSWLN